MRRTHSLLFGLLLAAACGGGGGGPAPALAALDLSFDFEVVRADAPTTRAVSIGNPFDDAVLVELVALPGSDFVIPTGIFPASVPAGSELSFDVGVEPNAPGETVGVLAVLVSTDPGGTEREVNLALRAEVEEPILRLFSDRVDFGPVRIGADGTASIGLRNESALTPIRLDALPPLPAGLSYAGAGAPSPIAPGANASIPLRYVPDRLGNLAVRLALGHTAGSDLFVDLVAQTDTWVERIVVDYGTVAVVEGDTAFLELEVPAHAISVSVEATGPDGAEIGLSGFEGPGGVVYENDSITGDFLQYPGEGVFAATLPNDDRPSIQLVAGGGTYRFRFRIFSGSAAELDARAIVLNRPDGVVSEGRLDLNIFLANGLGISAADAPEDNRLQALLVEADRIFAQQGLRIGAVSYYEVDDPALDEITSNAEFGTLLEESAAADEERLNLFFVKTALGGGVLGVAARLSGPALNGTAVSGVMVDYDFGSATTSGYVTAHELGHYLGLAHTVEESGGHDLVLDTAECPATGTNAVCPTVGNDYLMHWRVLSAEPVITDGQARVILGHPLVGEKLEPLAVSGQQLASPVLASALAELPEGWCGCAPRPPQ